LTRRIPVAHRGGMTSDTGVVDPIRLPGPILQARAWLLGAWDRLPTLGRLFVALTAADILGRTIGLPGMSLGIELSVPVTIVSAFVPHDLLILLPALLIARRHDAATATPLLFRAAVVLSLVQLLAGPVANAAAAGAGEAGFIMATLISIAATVMRTGAWLAMGISLAELAAGPPRPALAGLSNAIFVLLAASAAIGLILLIALGPPDLGDPLWTTLSLLSTALGTVEAIAFAYLARVVIRGATDTRRPPLATFIASAAMVVSAIVTGIGGVVALAALVQLGFDLSNGPIGAQVSLGWIETGLPLTAFLVSFGLGLGDTSPREVDSSEAEADPGDEGPGWPTPGSVVPGHDPGAVADPGR
jgi:hypothetical protein